MFSSTDDGKENFPCNDVDEFLNYVEDDDSGDNIPPNGDETTFTKDDVMMKPLQANIATRSISRPFHINPKHSSYTRARTKYLTTRSSVVHLISSEFCRRDCLKNMDFKFALEKRKTYMSMNKSMQNSYLVGCMQSTLAGYDYHIGNVLLCRKAFKMLYSIGNCRLSRIQDRLERDCTYYSEARYKREVGSFANTAKTWMKDFFSNHGECMPNKDTIHIPDNFSRREIFMLYKDYAEAVEGIGNFITYSYFTRIWKAEFNNVRIPKKTRMGICSTCASLKAKRYKCQGAESGMCSKHCFLKFDTYQL